MIHSKIIRFFSLAALVAGFSTLAHAQASRTWVSGVGDDANPCSRTAPCKTFAGAISRTAAGGEIDVLDPGGFGAVTITKSIIIDGGGGQVASVLVNGGNGIVVQAGPSDFVTIRNIRINGIGGGINGIRFTSGAGLNVINCFIDRFTTNGIDVALNQGNTATVLVSGTTVKNCGQDGISLSNAAGTVKTTIEHSSLVDNNNGLHGRNGSRTTASHCDFSTNAQNGVWADATNFATIRVWQSQISLNFGNGVQAGGGADNGSGVEIGQNQINNNGGNGVLVSTGGGVETFTNNSIRGNGSDGCAGCSAVGPGS